MRKALGALLVLGVGLAVWGLWPAAKKSPEQEIRELVARCVAAAEKRDIGVFTEAIADDFRGPNGSGKQDVKQVLLGHFFRSEAGMVIMNPSLDVTVESPTTAAFTGTFVFARGSSPQLVQGEGVSRYDIKGLVEKRSDGWVVVGASWQQ